MLSNSRERIWFINPIGIERAAGNTEELTVANSSSNNKKSMSPWWTYGQSLCWIINWHYQLELSTGRQSRICQKICQLVFKHPCEKQQQTNKQSNTTKQKWKRKYCPSQHFVPVSCIIWASFLSPVVGIYFVSMISVYMCRCQLILVENCATKDARSEILTQQQATA